MFQTANVQTVGVLTDLLIILVKLLQMSGGGELLRGINLQSRAGTIRALSRFLIYRGYHVVDNLSWGLQDKRGNSEKLFHPGTGITCWLSEHVIGS